MDKLNLAEALEKKIDGITTGAFSTYDAEVLIPEVEKLEKGDIYLEVGVDKGKSLLFAYFTKKSGVKTIGVDIRYPEELKKVLEKYPDIVFFCGRSQNVARLTYNEGYISLLHIDGDHTYQGCKTDIESWFRWMKKGGVMLFHDCDESSPGVMQAVAEFVNTHTVKKFELFKRTDKNTSMARIEL